MINCPKFKDNGLQMHAYDYIFVIVNASAFEKKIKFCFSLTVNGFPHFCKLICYKAIVNYQTVDWFIY